MKHEWDHNKPEQGYSTCAHCHIVVKTWRAKKGGLPLCESVKQVTIQKAIEYIPPCLDKSYEYVVTGMLVNEQGRKEHVTITQKNPHPVIACFECPGKIVAKKCDNLLEQGRMILDNRII